MKVILLNGPPRSGKDTAASAITSAIRGAECMKFAAALKQGTHALFGLGALDHDHFESRKDEPLPEFHGLTPRQAYIQVSESAVKPTFGSLFFGVVLAEAIKRKARQGVPLVAVSDSGFAHEVTPIIHEFGARNVMLIRLHAPGRGCTFANDSRSHIELENIATIDVLNDGNRDDFCHTVAIAVRSFAWVADSAEQMKGAA